ncbi:SDR family NAD(P)-dependent oxidoreductase [Candidatus Leptofilum sp.]|uniref:SDR family NAD(P)-dependent oxidoreductase n=1 Tax=Candidatus Leptofilum sp. TaxID=3241576 RepID=UPI003B5CC4B4
MSNTADRAIAIVAVGALLPDASSAAAFWQNVLNKRYSITETPANRWSIADYYDPDPKAPDKTYSKIGGWVRDFSFDWKRFRMPPKVAASMDEGQQWAVTVAADVLADYGYPERPLDTDRVATIIGTAMGGELHYQTNTRIVFPEYANALTGVAEFQALPAATREAILTGWHNHIDQQIPPITEDSMPGELPNIVSGRVANMLNLRGPNFITDAACASSFAAVEAAVEMLTEHKIDAVIAGGVDRNMGIGSFVKFCKIGALSATGTRPFGDGADGFVMGEGTGLFLLKRLADAERDGDKIYAVIRGVGGASDGKGKGITAPNPIGQQLAISRAWENAGLDPATAGMVEAHGTSTRVGDVVEVESLTKIFGEAKRGSIGLGSAKSNIGHLKAGAGAAGMLKATMALHHKILPPTLNANPPNPNIDFSQTPFALLNDARNWETNGTPRRAGVSAYGFGGTNFHLVLEEHIPGALTRDRKQFAVSEKVNGRPAAPPPTPPASSKPAPPRGIVALGANDTAGLSQQLDATLKKVEGGWTPEFALPETAVVQSPERLVIDFGNHEELLGRLQKAQKVMGMDSHQAWKAMEAQGIFRGSGKPKGKIAFMFPGQGSQYVNMGQELVEFSPIVKKVFDEADAVMKPILGKPLTDYIFVDPEDKDAINQATFDLMQTEITQPAMLTMDIAIFKLLQSYGFNPDMVMGHSLGEYAALIAAGIMPFAHALEASAARGAEMAAVDVPDKGKMAAVLAPYEEVEAVLNSIDGYVVPANINSRSQCVFGGASEAVEEAVKQFEAKGYRGMLLPVSHAFHTSIVAPASEPLRRVLDRLDIRPGQLPLVANVTGEIYPTDVEAIKDMLKLQIASPVQWVKGLETLYAQGMRTFVEVGPKRALRGFANDVFADKEDVTALMTNHPKNGTMPSFNQALCGLYAAGYAGQFAQPTPPMARGLQNEEPVMKVSTPAANGSPTAVASPDNLGQLLQALQTNLQSPVSNLPYNRNQEPNGSVVISGTGLGLPGTEKPVMDPDNALRILQGEQFVDLIPERFRRKMVGKQITRLVKAADGGGSFATIDDQDKVIRLAGRPGSFDLAEEYGVPQKLVDALDITTQLAMAAGLDALREAGIPLTMTYKKTTTGSYLPQKWMLPEALRDETGVIFASAFPGGDRFAEDFERFYTHQSRVEQLEMLEDLRRYASDQTTLLEITRRINELREQLTNEPYIFDRRFIFRILAMGHSQFAEYIGARGPNTHVNAACASTTQGIALAEDWIRNGRCRRVIVIAADDVTGDHLMEWVGSGFLALGAAATDDKVDEAALPFDKRRHGTILGMGACALVLESEDAVQERGMRGIVEVLSTETRNSAFHGSRLDVDHISMVMDDLLKTAESRFGLNRYAMAPQLVFMSHETFTPARGGSAAAEVTALRENFGDAAKEIIVANTKGFTGHPMGVGVEDVIALKILEHGIVPPVPNYKEVDPDLGQLNLSRGGRYPVQYSLHLAAGFGSQIAFSLTRRIPGGPNRIDQQPRYQQWLDAISGYDYAELEVEKRNLRIVAKGNPGRPPAPSNWQYGTGPVVRTQIGQGSVGVAAQPAPIVMPEPIISKQSSVISEPVKEELEPKPVEAKPAEVKVETAVPEPTPPPAEPISNLQSPVSDTVTEQVLNIIAEQTGYPTEMLEPELDLEADLGIDTVKQAETFVAIRQAFDIPRRDDLNLRDYNTLERVVGFVKEMRPELAVASEPVISSQSSVSSESVVEAEPISNLQSPVSDPVMDQVLNIIAEQTGYPVDMLEPDLDLEADLGIDTVKQAETFVAIRQAFDIPRRDDLNLRDYNTLARVVGFVREMRPELAVASEPVISSQSSASSESVVEAEPISNLQSPVSDPVMDEVLNIIADQTGYPIDMLEPDLDLEADLGIDTVKQAETFVAIRQAFDIPRRDDLNLRDYNTLARVVGFVREMRPELAVSEPAATETAVSEPVATSEAPATDGDPVMDKVLNIIAEQTGYPVDMLEPDLDLEADLGIDTVKQAETFVAIRQAFDIPRRDDLNLRDYNTLAKVVGFVHEMRPDLKAASRLPVEEKAETAVSDSPAAPQTAVSQYNLEDADTFPRRVATAVLRPDLDECVPTGVVLDENSRVIVALDEGGVGKALVKKLEKMGATVLTLDVTLPQAELEAQLQSWLADGAIQGVYWLPALDVEADLMTMDLAAWREANRIRVKNLSITMRVLYDVVNEANNFLVSATRLGGQHGYDSNGAVAPLGGGVTGFTKAYRHERPSVLVKAVDFEVSRKTAAFADLLIAETITDPGVVEVGYVGKQRTAVTLLEQPAADGEPGLTLDKETVFVVTGAAGGITSAIVSDLAAASGGIFYLLDLVEAPAPDDPHIQLFREDENALKTQLIAEAKAAGEKPTPVMINKKLMAIERSEAALSAIEAVTAAGGLPLYHSVNLLDGEAITAVVENIRETYGKIDVLVHAGGIEISRGLDQKDAAQFDLVYDIKSDGFFSLLSAAKEMPIGATVVFSSVAGRFGNNGQTDYSAANDLLCKLTSSFRNTRPNTKGIAIDWTAWGGIGMATRGSIPRIMEMAGIEMLPPEVGVPTVRRELVASGFKGEILAGGKLGILIEERHPTGGLDLDKVNDDDLLMVGKVTAYNLYGGLQAETVLDPNEQPFLFDHAMDGTPLLPGVMGTETFAEIASLVAPGYAVTAVENEDFHAPFKYYRMEPQMMILSATAVPNGKEILVHTSMHSRRELKTGIQEKLHFTATVRLGAKAPKTKKLKFKAPKAEDMNIGAEDIYKIYFHGPAYQVLESVQVDGGTAIGLLAQDLPANCNPVDAPELIAPRLVEFCFQTAGVWEIHSKQQMALPLAIGSVTAYKQEADAKGRLYAIVEAVDDGAAFNAQVVDKSGNVFVELNGYRTVQLPGEVSL